MGGTGIRPAHALAIAIAALLALSAGLLAVLAGREPEGFDMRLFTFAVVLGIAAAIVAVSTLGLPDPMRAIIQTAAGSAATIVGVFGAGTLGLLLVPIGMTALIMGLVAAEGTPTVTRTFIACGLAGIVASAIVASIALIGR